jgi:hypothetical protein
MHMLRHHDIAGHREEIAPANTLQRVLNEIHGKRFMAVAGDR